MCVYICVYVHTVFVYVLCVCVRTVCMYVLCVRRYTQYIRTHRYTHSTYVHIGTHTVLTYTYVYWYCHIVLYLWEGPNGEV